MECSGVSLGWQPLFFGLFLFLLQSLVAPHNPFPLPSLLPFFPAPLHLCFSSKMSLTCCLSFPLLSLSDLKSINASIPVPAHLRAGDPRSYLSSDRKTGLLPSAPRRAADTDSCHSPSPWGLSSRPVVHLFQKWFYFVPYCCC